MFSSSKNAWLPDAMSRQDAWIAAGLGLFFFLLYAFTGSVAPDEWDSVQFVFAIDDFNMQKSQPHPPGYPLYVAAGWLIKTVAGLDNHHSLTLVSAFGGGALVTALFLWARLILVRSWALGSVFSAGVAPAMWMSSIKALTDASASAFFLGAVALATAACLRKRPALLLAAAGCGALAAGLRPQNSFVLVILLLSAGLWGRFGWRCTAGALGVWALGCLVWLLPTMWIQAHASHGHFLTSYWTATQNQFQWRFDKPSVYAGAALATDPWLIHRMDDHICGWVTHGLGDYWSPTLWLLVFLLLAGWAGSLKVLFFGKTTPLREVCRLNFCWVVPYILMIFIFLPADQRYYIPVLGLLAVFSVAGWSSWTPWLGKVACGLAALIPLMQLMVSAPLAWQSRQEPAPPFRAFEWLDAKVPLNERSRTLLVIRESIRHFQYLKSDFRHLSAGELRNPARWDESLPGVNQVYTEVSDLPELLKRKELVLTEVARFERPEAIQRKHRLVVLYRVDGWQSEK